MPHSSSARGITVVSQSDQGRTSRVVHFGAAEARAAAPVAAGYKIVGQRPKEGRTVIIQGTGAQAKR